MPYDRMWADDRHWVPLMFARTPFVARFLFDEETMLEKQIEVTGG
jgi:8-oxo-dGTP diphosphatase